MFLPVKFAQDSLMLESKGRKSGYKSYLLRSSLSGIALQVAPLELRKYWGGFYQHAVPLGLKSSKWRLISPISFSVNAVRTKNFFFHVSPFENRAVLFSVSLAQVFKCV